MEIAGRTRILLGLKRPGGGREVVVWDTDEISVGRAPDNDIVIDGDDVSRHHLRSRPVSKSAVVIFISLLAQGSGIFTYPADH